VPYGGRQDARLEPKYKIKILLRGRIWSDYLLALAYQVRSAGQAICRVYCYKVLGIKANVLLPSICGYACIRCGLLLTWSAGQPLANRNGLTCLTYIGWQGIRVGWWQLVAAMFEAWFWVVLEIEYWFWVVCTRAQDERPADVHSGTLASDGVQHGLAISLQYGTAKCASE
jgi:hypothetical protein